MTGGGSRKRKHLSLEEQLRGKSVQEVAGLEKISLRRIANTDEGKIMTKGHGGPIHVSSS